MGNSVTLKGHVIKRHKDCNGCALMKKNYCYRYMGQGGVKGRSAYRGSLSPIGHGNVCDIGYIVKPIEDETLDLTDPLGKYWKPIMPCPKPTSVKKAHSARRGELIENLTNEQIRELKEL